MEKEIEISNHKEVKCNGGGNEGHPLIYLYIENEKEGITCPYCSKIFKYND
ncbi:MAG: zinc-finger domain-containing protein [Alphaproteobacteria bacterium]